LKSLRHIRPASIVSAWHFSDCPDVGRAGRHANLIGVEVRALEVAAKHRRCGGGVSF
jgi:hypothetical protein